MKPTDIANMLQAFNLLGRSMSVQILEYNVYNMFYILRFKSIPYSVVLINILRTYEMSMTSNTNGSGPGSEGCERVLSRRIENL